MCREGALRLERVRLCIVKVVGVTCAANGHFIFAMYRKGINQLSK